MRLALLAILMATPAWADEADAVDARVRRVAARASGGVVSVMVSYDARHLALPPDAPPPLELGRYPTAREQAPDWNPTLDLSDPRNIADYTLGSGVVLTSDGLILTPFSLIDGARKIYVRTSTGAGSYANIHAADARADLAVIRLLDPPPKLVPLPISPGRTLPGPNGEPATIEPGQIILTLGHATPSSVAEGSPSVTWGTLAAVRRRLPAPATVSPDAKSKPLAQFGVLLQTDARTTFPTPGAALLNLAGELIGLGTPSAALTGADAAGGFAIPMDPNYRRIIETLREGREVEYGFLGVRLFDNMRFRPRPIFGEGLLVTAIPGGPAAQAGLDGDMILALDGQPIRDADDLFLAAGAALAGTEVTLDLQHPADRQARRAKVTLGKYWHELPRLVSAPPPTAFGITVDHATLCCQQNGIAAVPPGVLVTALAPPAAARFAALPAAPDAPPRIWVVTHVNAKPIALPRNFVQACAGQETITLTVAEASRPADSITVTLP